jgi:tyrosine-protein kinase Etk/Wzc
MTEGTLRAGERARDDDQIDLLDHLLAIWRRRWLVAAIFAAGVLGGLAYFAAMPKMYEGVASILPPKEAQVGSLGGLVAAAGLPAIPGLVAPSSSPARDNFVSILKSRTLAAAAVERFKLKERYRVDFVEDAIKLLQTKRVSVETIMTEPTVTVRVEDTDPRVAADIANFFVGQLDKMVRDFGMSDAARQREFLTVQLARAKTDLDGSAAELRRFQERHQAIGLPEQTRAAIEAAARLKAEIVSAEVQLQVMRTFATEANPDVMALRQRIEEMNRHLAQVQYGDGRTEPAVRLAAPDRPDFVVPFAKVPEIGVELAKLTTNVRVQEAVVLLLSQQVEQNRIAEVKDLPTAQILDRATPPARTSRPKLMIDVAVGAAIGLFGGIFVAFAAEYFGTLRARRRTA